MTSYLDSESLSPTEFYARRSVELRVAADESAVRYSRHTLILAILGLLGGLAFYQPVFVKRWALWTAIPVVAAVAWAVQQRLQRVEYRSYAGNRYRGRATLAKRGNRQEWAEFSAVPSGLR